MPTTTPSSRQLRFAAALGAATLALALVPGAAANAATTIDGPIGLGTAATYGVLASSTITNTGPTTVGGDVGLSPGSAVVGFTGPPTGGSYTGALNVANEAAATARADLTTAYNVAAGLSPNRIGLGNLGGQSLVPGVYSGTNLSLTGTLTLEGNADSVWVFQADETLITSTASDIVFNGDATSCNVFWQVGSSATLGTDSDFVGTILADQSISVTTGADIDGRLLARVGAVTLQSNDIVIPNECGEDGEVGETPSPTVGDDTPPDGTVGTPYEFEVPADGEPTPSVELGEGSTLPPGLELDDDGTISGTPTTPGEYTFEVIVSNGNEPDVTVEYDITIVPEDITPTPGPSTPPTTPTPSAPGTPGDGGGDGGDGDGSGGGGSGDGDSSDGPGDGLAYSGTEAVSGGALLWAVALTALGSLALAFRIRLRRADARS
ncbi:ice-binding family protein [Labedella endophytica]|uniref:DUF3494 domain-containing protein n=1 Tax=Labedella endophytica TaxID=1523160 RepID=A0A3S0XLH0_9MICO|nr:ice-binding family protein [Labedella endophytica]RUQ99108.1 DUF3494 domain-containing protein [Labedella endophytica]